ncbi:hypothetical protein D3C76_1025720 [compost metagenome]
MVHGRGERADAVQAAGGRMHAGAADAAEGRLQAGDAAAGRRYAHRATGIGAQGDIGEAGSDRYRRTAGRATRHALRRLRVTRRAGPVVDAGNAERQFVKVGLADDAPAGIEHRVDHVGVALGWRGVGQRAAAAAGRLAGDVDGVLDRDAQTVAAKLEFADEHAHAGCSSRVAPSGCWYRRRVRKWLISQVPATQRKSMSRRVPNSSLRPSA